MLHQVRHAAEQPRGVGAQRQILVDALPGVMRNRGLGITVGPEILHIDNLTWRIRDRVSTGRLRRRRRPHARRSEEPTSELQSLMRISYAVFCLKKKKKHDIIVTNHISN